MTNKCVDLQYVFNKLRMPQLEQLAGLLGSTGSSWAKLVNNLLTFSLVAMLNRKSTVFRKKKTDVRQINTTSKTSKNLPEREIQCYDTAGR